MFDLKQNDWSIQVKFCLVYIWQHVYSLQGGSIPHLTYEVLQMVTKVQQPLHIPISTIAHCHEAVLAFRKGIADFIGLKVIYIYTYTHTHTTSGYMTLSSCGLQKSCIFLKCARNMTRFEVMCQSIVYVFNMIRIVNLSTVFQWDACPTALKALSIETYIHIYY
jgi:hypothetical protein